MHEPHDAFHEILVVAETAGLPPLSEDRQRFAPERLGDERWRDPSVRGPHPRTVSVEDPDDPRVDAVLAVVGHGQRFREALGLVVDAPHTDRVDVAPVAFRLRVDQWVAVNLGGGRQEESRAFCPGQTERVVCAQGAYLQDLDRHALEIHRTGGTGEMHDEIHVAVDVQVFGYVLPDVGEPFAVHVVSDVYGPARNQIVDGDYLVAVGQQPVA